MASVGVARCGVGVGWWWGAFGAFAFLGVGRSSYELCASDSVVELESASRVWLPVVGSSCTYAPSYDQRVMMVVLSDRFVPSWLPWTEFVAQLPKECVPRTPRSYP